MQQQTNSALQQALGNDAAFVEMRGILEWVDGVGKRFFVSSTIGHANNNGRTPTTPVATIAQAHSLCTAAKGDRIYLLPGHTETITAAAGIAITKSGVSIIGLGMGSLRPTINFTTAATADLDVDADNVTFVNIYFDLTGVDSLDAPLDINADDCTFEGCEFLLADSGGQCDLAILTVAGVDRLKVVNCHFQGSSAAGVATAIRLVGGDGHKILNTTIIGYFTTTLGGIDNATTASTNIVIANNFIANNTASAAAAIAVLDGTTGFIVNNRLLVLTGTAPIAGTTPDVWVGGNYYKAAVGVTAGTLL